jgi:hypothetical protein
VELPAWGQDDIIKLRLADLPQHVAQVLRLDLHCHAEVNLGAEDATELYFRNWEPT